MSRKGLKVHLVLCLGGSPSPPTRPRSSERGGSASRLSSGAGGLAPASLSGAGEVGAARSLQTPLSRASDVVDSPQFSPHVPRRGNSERVFGILLPRVILPWFPIFGSRIKEG